MKQKHLSDDLFATASVRAREGKLLSEERVRHILTADTRMTTGEILRGTIFGDYLDRHGITDPAMLIPHVRDDVFLFLRRHVTQQGAVHFLLLPYDYHNLKVLLKGKLLDLPAEEILLSKGSIDEDELREIFHREEFSLLPERMSSALNRATSAWVALKDPRILDTVPDRYMLLHLLEVAGTLDSPWLTGYCHLLIDCSNFRILSRAGGIDENFLRDYSFISGGNISLEEITGESPESFAVRHDYPGIAAAFSQEERAFAVERACGTELRRYLNESCFAIGGIEPLMAFAITVEEDLRILGTLLRAREAGMEEGMVRKRIPAIP